jgi:tRNA threonylcarbamoyladenosine biosynthesis protein TsaB
MLILSIRTDMPEAEVGLFEDSSKLGYKKWAAHRELSDTIHLTIKELLSKHYKSISEIQGLIVFQGPGSFTGLRIGISVANALAYGLSVPIVAGNGDDWLKQGTTKLISGQNQQIVRPEYGAPVHITQQKH